MFTPKRTSSVAGAAVGTLDLIYHNTVRSVRKGHENAFMSLLMNMMQSILLVAIFYVIFEFFNLRSAAVRGDFLLFVMTGIFLFMTHIKAMSAVVSSEGPASPMMNHLPMNTAIAITSAALGALHIQVLTVILILSIYHLGWGPVEIHNPVGAMGMVILSWFSGVAVGMVFLAIKPWFPSFVNITSQIYMRANMVASGKMFLANALPSSLIAMFDWNPLFHTIDQSRGFAFVNYNPHHSSISYPIYLSLALLALGLLGEFYTRKHASVSWQARR